MTEILPWDVELVLIVHSSVDDSSLSGSPQCLGSACLLVHVGLTLNRYFVSCETVAICRELFDESFLGIVIGKLESTPFTFNQIRELETRSASFV